MVKTHLVDGFLWCAVGFLFAFIPWAILVAIGAEEGARAGKLMFGAKLIALASWPLPVWPFVLSRIPAIDKTWPRFLSYLPVLLITLTILNASIVHELGSLFGLAPVENQGHSGGRGVVIAVLLSYSALSYPMVYLVPRFAIPRFAPGSFDAASLSRCESRVGTSGRPPSLPRPPIQILSEISRSMAGCARSSAGESLCCFLVLRTTRTMGGRPSQNDLSLLLLWIAIGPVGGTAFFSL